MRSQPGGVGWVTGPGNQDHPRSAPSGLVREREAHPPAGAIRNIANRIQRLTRGSGSDQYALIPKVTLGIQGRTHCGNDVVQFRQSPGPDRAAGEFSHSRLHDPSAARPEGGQVLAGRGMLPHVRVHGRRQHERTAKGKMGRAEEIVGEPQRELGQHVRGGGRDKQDVSALSDIDVGNGAVQRLVGRTVVEQVRDDLVARQGSDGERGDELGGSLGQNSLHGVPIGLEGPHQLS